MAEPSAASLAPAFLTRAQPLADAALDRVLPSPTTWPARLHEAMRYSVFAGGKRLRPALVLAATEACGGDAGDASEAMAAVELLHTYTLIHDDLPAMDDDDLRRGRPTCHRAFDEATAILAGDALQAAAFGCTARISAEAVAVLAVAAGSTGVVGGQQADCEATGAQGGAIGNGAALEAIHRAKTAALISASCELGAMSARADATRRAQLRAFGVAAGLAFQIADDCLDATASSAVLGKTAGKDAAQGKLTYVALYGLDGARALAARQTATALDAIAPLGAAGATLAALAHLMANRDH